MNKAQHNFEALNGFLYNGQSEQESFIIYSGQITPRLVYTCRFIFQQGLVSNFKITSDVSEFSNSELIKINYSDTEINNSLQIIPAGLLSETGVKEFVPTVKNNDQGLQLFPSKNNSFDIFSAVFYFISRYEEWQKFVKDNHQRFEVRNSILYKLSLVKTPVVDVWLTNFKLQLQKLSPGLKWKPRQFKYVSTIDVDNLYAFKAKPLLRNIGGALKDVMGGNFKLLGARLSSVLFGKNDPFDAYAYQYELSKQNGVPLIYFFLYRTGTQFDRTIQPNHPAFKALFKDLNAKNSYYGLHPSYFTCDDEGLLRREVELFNQNSDKKLRYTRQHYLRFNIKTTPQQLQQLGIEFDFTMGFAGEAGYRAGTGLPFYYYDFNTESELDIMAVPFALMDGAYYIYHNTNIKEAKAEILSMAAKARELNSLFITVFHDRTFASILFPGWKELYAEIQEELRP